MKKLELIRKIVESAEKKFICVEEKMIYSIPPIEVIKVDDSKKFRYSKKEVDRNIHNIVVLGLAIEKIGLIVRNEKEIWAKCPYCGLKYTKVIGERSKRKLFWCQSCSKKSGERTVYHES